MQHSQHHLFKLIKTKNNTKTYQFGHKKHKITMFFFFYFVCVYIQQLIRIILKQIHNHISIGMTLCYKSMLVQFQIFYVFCGVTLVFCSIIRHKLHNHIYFQLVGFIACQHPSIFRFLLACLFQHIIKLVQYIRPMIQFTLNFFKASGLRHI